jgi:hypothetical protein
MVRYTDSLFMGNISPFGGGYGVCVGDDENTGVVPLWAKQPAELDGGSIIIQLENTVGLASLSLYNNTYSSFGLTYRRNMLSIVNNYYDIALAAHAANLLISYNTGSNSYTFLSSGAFCTDSYLDGGVLYNDTTGSTGQVLTSNGATSAMKWTDNAALSTWSANSYTLTSNSTIYNRIGFNSLASNITSNLQAGTQYVTYDTSANLFTVSSNGIYLINYSLEIGSAMAGTSMTSFLGRNLINECTTPISNGVAQTFAGLASGYSVSMNSNTILTSSGIFPLYSTSNIALYCQCLVNNGSISPNNFTEIQFTRLSELP